MIEHVSFVQLINLTGRDRIALWPAQMPRVTQQICSDIVSRRPPCRGVDRNSVEDVDQLYAAVALRPPTQQFFLGYPAGASNHEFALIHWRSRIHVSAAVKMIVDLRGGTDHTSIQKHIERRCLQILFDKCSGSVVAPQDSEQH